MYNTPHDVGGTCKSGTYQLRVIIGFTYCCITVCDFGKNSILGERGIMIKILTVFALVIGMTLSTGVHAEKKQAISAKKIEQENIPMQDSFLERQVAYNNEIPPLAIEILAAPKQKRIQHDYYMSVLKGPSPNVLRDSRANTEALDAINAQCNKAKSQMKQIESNLANLKLDATKFFNGKLPKRFVELWETNERTLKDRIGDERDNMDLKFACLMG